MKTLFTSLTGVIYCVISIKHGLAHLYEKGQGDMCGRCSKFTIFSWECNVLCGLKLDLDITHPITRCVFRAVSF